MSARATLCKGCWGRLHLPVPIRGPASWPLRLVGVRVSRMNPNLCTLCETMFKVLMRAPQLEITATVLFADLRDYTGLSQRLEAPRVAELLSQFYERCSGPIWERDGLINKLIGDAVFAIFNFPIGRDDHTRQAVLSGLELQARCAELRELLAEAGVDEPAAGVGVGIHTGRVAIGEIGQFCRDFTAIGEVVNLAARLQGAARPGEVLVTEAVYGRVADLVPEAEARAYQLKGLSQPVHAYALGPAGIGG